MNGHDYFLALPLLVHQAQLPKPSVVYAKTTDVLVLVAALLL